MKLWIVEDEDDFARDAKEAALEAGFGEQDIFHTPCLEWPPDKLLSSAKRSVDYLKNLPDVVVLDLGYQLPPEERTEPEVHQVKYPTSDFYSNLRVQEAKDEKHGGRGRYHARVLVWSQCLGDADQIVNNMWGRVAQSVPWRPLVVSPKVKADLTRALASARMKVKDGDW